MRPPSHPQSYLRNPLSQILGNESSVRVLRALATRGLPLSTSQLTTECGLSPRGVRLALENLVATQVVNELGALRSKLYSTNTRHPLIGELTELFMQELRQWEELLGRMRDVLKQHPIAAAWYYGSVARGEDRPDSDFDLAIVVQQDAELDQATEAVRQELQEIEEHYQIRCSVVGLSDADVRRMSGGDEEFWKNLRADAKTLLGPRPEQYVLRFQQGNDE